ncbi:hypothetical protein AMECASPLE_017455 [Ameca splendens]|uniref:Uncharacterized protein n=1 Tax=Ameca splendens TaxID=208324 RepID=A0ABV0YE30_9TELE
MVSTSLDIMRGIWEGPSHSGNMDCSQTEQFSRCSLKHRSLQPCSAMVGGSIMVWAAIMSSCDGSIWCLQDQPFPESLRRWKTTFLNERALNVFDSFCHLWDK